jgi:hypothetical protein
MTPSGLYSIDGLDWFDTYGFAVLKTAGKGKDAFLKFFDAKTPLSHDWPDEHGTEYDETQPLFFKEKEILIDGLLTADTYDQFWERHRAMQTLFGLAGTRRVYVNSLQRSFYLIYDSCTDFGVLTPLNDEFEGKIGCRYSFKFKEPVPSFWQPFTYLTDIHGNHIITVDNNKIIIPT